MTSSQSPFHVLSIEDNPADRYLIRKFFNGDTDRYKISFTLDGCDALEFLQRKGPYVSAVRPDLILLDLNLPKKDGREVLKEVKKHPELKDIPIFVFTTSKSAEDKTMSLSLGAEQFISKPSDIPSFQKVFVKIRVWLESGKKDTIRN